MEAWTDPQRIASAMATILEIEAEAARAVSIKAGLEPLLSLLRERKVKCRAHVRLPPCMHACAIHSPGEDTHLHITTSPLLTCVVMVPYP